MPETLAIQVSIVRQKSFQAYTKLHDSSINHDCENRLPFLSGLPPVKTQISVQRNPCVKKKEFKKYFQRQETFQSL